MALRAADPRVLVLLYPFEEIQIMNDLPKTRRITNNTGFGESRIYDCYAGHSVDNVLIMSALRPAIRHLAIVRLREIMELLPMCAQH